MLPETKDDLILELESDIVAIKLKVLRAHHPNQPTNQPTLPGMENLLDAKEGRQSDVAS